jgi:hypothetical protein
MSEKLNGQRAFPWCGDLNDCPTINLGMTLRDYFAAAALQGIVQNTDIYTADENQQSVEAYRIADAMLKERAK